MEACWITTCKIQEHQTRGGGDRPFSGSFLEITVVIRMRLITALIRIKGDNSANCAHYLTIGKLQKEKL